jgi:hypothetical protein
MSNRANGINRLRVRACQVRAKRETRPLCSGRLMLGDLTCAMSARLRDSAAMIDTEVTTQ